MFTIAVRTFQFKTVLSLSGHSDDLWAPAHLTHFCAFLQSLSIWLNP